MKTHKQDVHPVQEHYQQQNLLHKLLAALEAAGKPLDTLTREDLAPFEEFHIRGREATREIAQYAGFADGMHVLDIGSGIGGPARTLGAEFGCRVTGIDLVPEYVDAAVELTRRVGLSDRVQFQQASALKMPFPDGQFDAALLEHVNMNIEDKGTLFREAARVLRPGGVLALYEICAGPNAPPHYPVPWAGDPSISFLVRPEQLIAQAEAARFRTLKQRDVSQPSLDWLRTTAAAMSQAAAAAPDAPPPLGLHLIMGADARQKFGNVMRNLEEDRIRVIQAVIAR